MLQRDMVCCKMFSDPGTFKALLLALPLGEMTIEIGDWSTFVNITHYGINERKFPVCGMTMCQAGEDERGRIIIRRCTQVLVGGEGARGWTDKQSCGLGCRRSVTT